MGRYSPCLQRSLTLPTNSNYYKKKCFVFNIVPVFLGIGSLALGSESIIPPQITNRTDIIGISQKSGNFPEKSDFKKTLENSFDISS